MINSVITILRSIYEWIIPKFNTKEGTFFLGVILGLIPPVSYAYYSEQYISYLKEELANYNNEIDDKNKQIEYWQNRAFGAEQNHIQKTKEMIETLNSLEDYYINKNQTQKENNALMSSYIDKLNKVANRLEQSK